VTGGILSRLAESMYWIGRYVERADDTARVVNTYVHRVLEGPFNDENASYRSLFAILGVEMEGEDDLGMADVLERLVFDTANPSSIAGSLAAAHDNARRAREAISSEMWVCLNSTNNELRQRQVVAARLGAATFLSFVRERSALFTGLADATISHDDGWQFLVLGRSLERIDMTARLLEGRLLAAEHSPDWLTLLRASGAMESFLRASSGVADPEAVASFLLLDRLFPRSAYHALSVADDCLAQLSPPDSRTGIADQARRTIGRARHRLEYADPRRVLDDLSEILEYLERTCATANDEITERYFRQAAAITWAAGEGT
jgi:uncharacterized alpha-E superfamily protein